MPCARLPLQGRAGGPRVDPPTHPPTPRPPLHPSPPPRAPTGPAAPAALCFLAQSAPQACVPHTLVGRGGSALTSPWRLDLVGSALIRQCDWRSSDSGCGNGAQRLVCRNAVCPPARLPRGREVCGAGGQQRAFPCWNVRNLFGPYIIYSLFIRDLPSNWPV